MPNVALSDATYSRVMKWATVYRSTANDVIAEAIERYEQEIGK